MTSYDAPKRDGLVHAAHKYLSKDLISNFRVSPEDENMAFETPRNLN